MVTALTGRALPVIFYITTRIKGHVTLLQTRERLLVSSFTPGMVRCVNRVVKSTAVFLHEEIDDCLICALTVLYVP